MQKDSSKLKKNNIALIGFKCSGKTTVGKYINDKHGYQYIDTDKELLKFINNTTDIKKLYSQIGELKFRKLENKVLYNIYNNIKQNNISSLVIATGGGSVLNQDIKNIKKVSNILYLDTPFDLIIDRLKITDNSIFSKNNSLDLNKIFEVYNNRRKIYEKIADIIISQQDLAELSLDNIVNKIISLISPT